jgi:aminoglycoside phosphotransferase (APT) family kinase protein
VPLARFLRTLHGLHPSDVGDQDLPDDPTRRADMEHRAAMTERRIEAARELGVWHAPARVTALVAAARALPPVARPVTLAHGDLHVRHLVVGRDGRLAGVIDWGDLCRADPSIDLVLYWSFLPPAGRPAFEAEYGPIDPGALVRSRLLAVFLSLTLAVYGRTAGHAALERGALAALDRSVAA